MNPAQHRDRTRKGQDGPGSGRHLMRQPEVDVIDGLSGIRRRLLRNWNRCDDKRLRDTIRDAEEQIYRALQLLRNG